MQFVIRLRKDIHRELDKIPEGHVSAGNLSTDTILAFSTFFHENIHWWQHVGSTFGLISSLRFPAQSHVNFDDLKLFLNTFGPIKSIKAFDAAQFHRQKKGNKTINKILNNFYDLNIANLITFDPQFAKECVKNPYFDSIGHSYHIFWAASVNLLASCVDRTFDFLPNIQAWAPEFRKLREKKEMGFYYGSKIGIPPFGTKAIYEGQARFCQLQHLYFALHKQVGFDDFKRQGMLHGVYIQAFKYFLEKAGLSFPSKPDDPSVGLFLLICDISLNPSEGFPAEIFSYETFIISNDPGYRFLSLCLMLKGHVAFLLNEIKHYSRTEYIFLSEYLSNLIKSPSPHLSTQLVVAWAAQHNAIKELLREEASFSYNLENLPIRVFFSKFLRFQQDKYLNPQFFCWPGINMLSRPENSLDSSEIALLFDRHRALFVDKADANIYPMLFTNYTEESIYTTFNNFFMWNCSYDIIRKWIIEDGPFTFNYQWLTTKYPQEAIEKWVSGNFENTFGHSPKAFKVV